MVKPKILVTGATGNIGFPTALQLLQKGYSVRAFVRRSNQLTQQLKTAGAEICVGSLDDFTDVSTALRGVQRAYYCAPWGAYMLYNAMTFAVVAQDACLEVVVAMSQWLADAAHPSLATRQTWLMDRVWPWLPGVGVVTVNPGFFADNYMALLEPVAHFGMFPLPLGEGLNAPPSNEDIARVVVGALVNPALHIGKTYRPTGPRLLAPVEIAVTFAKVLGRPVKYVNMPPWMAGKALRAMGMSPFLQAQVIRYFEDYRQNAFAVGAPTDAVRQVGGTAPEDFEAITRRYVAQQPQTQRTWGNKFRATVNFMKILFAPALNPASYEKAQNQPTPRTPKLAMQSSSWLAGRQSSAPLPLERVKT